MAEFDGTSLKLHVVLVEPEIASNTGNVIRLCANTGATLHLVEPLGFVMDDRRLRRAGLDYHDLADVRTHASFNACAAALGRARTFALTASASRHYDSVSFAAEDVLVFGAERAGLDAATLAAVRTDHHLGLPMRADNRSLNLANAVAVVVYEAWRQQGFTGAAAHGPTSEALDRG